MRRLLIAPAVFACQPALAADWTEITRLADGTMVSIDRQSLATSPPQTYSRDFPVIQVTARYGRTDGGTSAESRNSIDCAGRTITALFVTYFARDGSVARRWSRVDYDFNYRPVTPNSVGDAILQAVCSGPQAPDAAGN